jgi:NAD(P)H-dependent FMN reductase
MNVVLILGSVRDGRIGGNVLLKVKALIDIPYEIAVVDPLDYQLPLLNKRFFEMHEPEPVFSKLHKIFSEADGFIIISAEYNHSIPPALKNMLDHFGNEFRHKACGIVSYSDGAVGGARAAEHLRLVCSTLGMPPIGPSPAWGLAHKSNEPEGKSFNENFERQFKFFLKEFDWYLHALAAARSISN